MAMKKRPYELSVWVEQLNGSNSKIEKKGIIIGAHDMSYLGKATNLVLKRELKGTNTLTFQMPDRYFDSLSGEYVRNEFIDMLYNEAKLKLFYKDRWYEFFIKKIDEKKQHKSYMKTFTCTDAFIDELSRNGYGITYDTDLYNNVEEVGTFSERTLKDSIWKYHPEHNWGDFTEYKEEKLYKIPISQFGGTINGYKLSFALSPEQIYDVKKKWNTDLVTNVFNGDIRPVELSDDMCREVFWDQYVHGAAKDNSLKKDMHTDIPNDGYIYIPYSCLGFCYGSKEEPDETQPLKYDRAATETAIDIDGKLILAPQSVDPRTIIQFYAIPKDTVLEIDDAGVIMDKEYSFFMTLADWNRNVLGNDWYMFEDTRLVRAESLGSVDQNQPTISHTFKYLKTTDKNLLNTDWESRGNKAVFYDGYLSDINDIGIIKGKKFSISNRTEVNISKDIDSYPTIYNAQANDFAESYTSEKWEYDSEKDSHYRVCSKLATRQVIPQLARNLVQNGTNMDSIDGWSPMEYLTEESTITTPSVVLRGVINEQSDESIYTSALHYFPSVARVGYKVKLIVLAKDAIKGVSFSYNGSATVSLADENFVRANQNYCNNVLIPLNDMCNAANNGYVEIYYIGTEIYYKTIVEGVPTYKKFCSKNDFFHNALKRAATVKIEESTNIEQVPPNSDGIIKYVLVNPTITPSSSGNRSQPPTIAWEEDKNPKTKTGSITNGRQMVNFGIIGQEKKIEKQKIYCLGVAAKMKADTSFLIKIGKGTLISEGKYEFANDDILTFDAQSDLGIESGELPEGYDDEKKNIVVPKTSIKSNFILFKTEKDIENPYFVIESEEEMILLKAYLFEAYTKGVDSFENDGLVFRYSGRDLFWPPTKVAQLKDAKPDTIYTYTYPLSEEEMRKYVLFEDDIMLGSTYGYQQYFIQRLKTTEEEPKYYDTMGKKNYISTDKQEFIEGELPLDAAQYTEDDYEIQTNYIDLNKCPYYDQEADIESCDCTHSGGHSCYYQKFGYCPYRFEAEKHPRRVRTLSVSKSNRFNIIQEISKVFEIYPQFYIQHKSNGSVVRDNNEDYLKELFFITEKGVENKIGFRYEKNLKDISRNVVSDQIVTKLYVLDVDSELSKTGMCSIKTAEDNPSKDSYLIDLSYYIQKGMLDADEVEQDLYGKTPTIGDLKDLDTIPSGFLYQLGYYNQQYDDLSNKIINLQDASFTELEANLTVNYEGIITAQEQILKIKRQLQKYKDAYEVSKPEDYKEQQAYQNYLTKLSEQESILIQLIYSTFYTNGLCDPAAFDDEYPYHKEAPAADATALDFFSRITDLTESKKYWIDAHKYSMGILGQFNREYTQIQQWKRERASYLKLINQISSAFYKKYEPYLKEGTWSDSNYLTDNAYYFGALDVQAEGAIPKVSYTINVIDLAPLGEEYEDVYEFDIADVSYVEDIGMFGINKHTGLPNRLKVLISAVSETLDDGSKNSITVQNFTTSFQDLFQQVSASVQSLTYNENIYKRSSNFTSLQGVKTESLQQTLDGNDLTLLDTDENNIQVDNSGTRGSDINNHANKYKLDGQGLFFSNDGGQHWSVGVGPSGINADYIKVGTLDAGKIRIADGNYIYFSWDKEGIVAYRDPQGINTNSNNLDDSAIFNKYGLSIVQNGNIKLRAGYNFNGEEGKILSEKEMGDNVGFYLYNSAGDIIFSTADVSNTGSESEIAAETAQLYLKGEMLVTNAARSSIISGYVYDGPSITNSEEKFDQIITGDKLHTTSDAKEYMNIREDEDITEMLKQSGAYYLHGKNDNSTTTITFWVDKETEEGSITEKQDYTLTKKGTQKDKLCFIKDGSGNKYTTYERFKIEVSGMTETFDCVMFTDSNRYYGNSDCLGTGGAIQVVVYDHTQGKSEPGDQAKRGEISNCISRERMTTNDNTYGYKFCRTETQVYFERDDIKYTKEGEAQQSEVNGRVALYLNNKEDVKDDSGTDETRRLFVCCNDKDTSKGVIVNNIFSILKDGTLYIGGTVDQGVNASSLPDVITISNASITINKVGQLQMDFSNIIGADGESLTKYIAKEIVQESEALKTLVEGMISGATQGLAPQDHWHTFPETNLTKNDNVRVTITPPSQSGQSPFKDWTANYSDNKILIIEPGSSTSREIAMTVGDLLDTIRDAYIGQQIVS